MELPETLLSTKYKRDYMAIWGIRDVDHILRNKRVGKEIDEVLFETADHCHNSWFTDN